MPPCVPPFLSVCQSYDEYGGVEEYGSYPPSSFEEDAESLLNDAAAVKPRLLLMGSRRSGKSSIQKVVFHKMSPHETLFLEATNEIRVRDISTSALLQFHLLDFPGNFDLTDRRSSVTAEKIFRKPGTLVFVIDAQDDENQFSESIDYFLSLARLAFTINPQLHFAVLIHKVDGDAYITDEHKSDCHSEIKKTISEELQEAGLASLRPSFHVTSIYDHSIFEAFSKIVQQLIPSLPVLEGLLDGLLVSTGMDKAFLFDIVSKVYCATDSNPVDMQTYELCSDMIDVVIDVSCIYGLQQTASGVSRVEGLGYDTDSASIIHLSNDYTLYLREVNKYLALVCLMREDSWKRGGLVDYNFKQLKDAIAKVLDIKEGGGAAALTTGAAARAAAPAAAAAGQGAAKVVMIRSKSDGTV